MIEARRNFSSISAGGVKRRGTSRVRAIGLRVLLILAALLLFAAYSPGIAQPACPAGHDCTQDDLARTKEAQRRLPKGDRVIPQKDGRVSQLPRGDDTGHRLPPQEKAPEVPPYRKPGHNDGDASRPPREHAPKPPPQRAPQPPKHEQPWPSDHGKKGGHESYPYPPRGPGDWRDPPYTGTYFPPYPRDDPPPRTYPPPDNDYPPHETEPPPPQPEVPRSTYVQVPNVVGMSIVAARGAIFDRGLNPQYGGEQPDGSPPDKVATTSPRAGTMVPEGTSVSYWVAPRAIAKHPRTPKPEPPTTVQAPPVETQNGGGEGMGEGPGGQEDLQDESPQDQNPEAQQSAAQQENQKPTGASTHDSMGDTNDNGGSTQPPDNTIPVWQWLTFAGVVLALCAIVQEWRYRRRLRWTQSVTEMRSSLDRGAWLPSTRSVPVDAPPVGLRAFLEPSQIRFDTPVPVDRGIAA